jgi:hypothetical protein
LSALLASASPPAGAFWFWVSIHVALPLSSNLIDMKESVPMYR